MHNTDIHLPILLQRNTHQALVVTDNIATYTMYLYEDEEMNWEPTAYK